MKPGKEELIQASALIREAKIPPVPETVLKLQALLSEGDEAVDMDAVIELVMSNVALSGSVMNLVNRGGTNIGSIATAVVYLGLKRLKNVILAAALSEAIRPQTDFQRDFWEDSLACATACERFSTAKVVGFPEHAYMLGLFNDCGAMLLEQKDKRFAQIYKHAHAAPKSVLEIERKVFGTTHVAVSYVLTKYWALPQEVQMGVYYSHFERHDRLNASDGVISQISILKICNHLISQTLDPEVVIREDGEHFLERSIRNLEIDSQDLEDFVEIINSALQPK